MMYGEQVSKYLTDLLKSNVEDPNVNRKSLNKGWIYNDVPRLDISGYPRLSVVLNSSRHLPIDIGYNHEEVSYSISVIIQLKRFSKYKVKVDGVFVELSEYSLADYLMEQVLMAFHLNRAQMYKDGLYLKVDNTNKVDFDNSLRYVIDLSVIVINSIFKNKE